MKISSFVDITEGKLLNTPSISFITQIHIQVSKIDEGDAFLALNKKDIPSAVEKGAFVILFENSVNIIDNEIAWVQTPNMQKSITNILRYKFSKLEKIQFFYVDKILYHFLTIFKTKESQILFLKDNLKYDFELLISNNIEKKEIVFSTNNYFLQKVSPTFKIMQPSKYNISNLISYSLFESSFSYKGRYFDKIKLPKLYINYFLTIYNFFDKKIDIKKLTHLKLFKPLFINKSLQIVSFGETNRFILANSDLNIAKLEIRYINKFYKYGTIKVIEKEHITSEKIIFYIKKYNTNILYFKYIDIDTIEQILLANNKEDKLFY